MSYALALPVAAHPAYGTTDRPVNYETALSHTVPPPSAISPLMALQHIPHPPRSNHADRCTPHPLTLSVRPVRPMRTKYRVYFGTRFDDYQACTGDATWTLGDGCSKPVLGCSIPLLIESCPLELDCTPAETGPEADPGRRRTHNFPWVVLLLAATALLVCYSPATAPPWVFLLLESLPETHYGDLGNIQQL
jgi:hypothetical protein